MTAITSPPAPTSPRATPATLAGHAAPTAAPDPRAPPVHLLTTLIGALAVLAATTAIPPMISGSSWFWPTAEVVMVIWLVGVGARLARVPAAAAIGLQIVGASVALTALFTIGGVGGVIPNGAVLTEAGDLLTGAWDQIRTTVSPAPSSTELAFLISLAVGTTALVVDILIAVCRTPALVALPLLCVYSVPASIDLTMLPWLAFAVPAVLYAILLTADGLSGRRHGTAAGLAQVVTGASMAALATVIALLVAGSVTGVGTAGRLPRGTTGPSAGIGLSPFASLQGNLQRSDPVEMLRVSGPAGLDNPRYLRTVSLQKWTPGQGWSVDELTNGQLPNSPRPAEQPQVTVSSLSYRDRFLPIYGGTTAVIGAEPGWSYDAALESVHRPDAVTPEPYQLAAALPAHTADELRADPATSGGVLTETGELSAEVVEITAQVTAGADTAFDKADTLRRYFTEPGNGFTYSLTVPAGDSGDPLVDFLRNKQGYCEQYASAMAIMLRAAGVPARVAIGFTQGTQDTNGDRLISSNDAHAWVEVLFDQAGWVQFDPTPLGAGQGGQQGFTDSADTAPATESVPSEEVPSAGPGVDEPTTQGGAAAALPSEDTAAGNVVGDGPIIGSGLWWALAILALVAAAATGPTLVRNRRRRHRLMVADAGGPAGAAAAWREIEDLAVDHGIGLDPAESARAMANRLARAAHLTDQGRRELRSVVTTAELGWYGGDVDRPAVPSGSVASGMVASGTVSSGSVSSGTVSSGSVAASATVERPGSEALGAAPRTMALELQHNVPLSPLDRLVPRSVRPSWWRD